MVQSFDPKNPTHARIAALARDLTKEAGTIVKGSTYLSDPARALAARRRKLRQQLKDVPAFSELNVLCTSVLAPPPAKT
jgi:hypothetical protein